ncbi:inhibitory synaptic factor 2A [Acinonyx jubatus]|uniref:Inhibitory synaptic factor 2A n=1 Tax=Acinonyx jubatus TaxID=32536 RepID=A0A6J1ZPW4_ACIJB|nr:inhibitory synaptic factor 2A [Acinonyx jubatus]XP_053063826.1 inhibitory synaptic factor 2A [Acinonyx jubatus]XP_053063827.1 inhibitory synaptic factor 2A [Acinonyx jubatus]
MVSKETGKCVLTTSESEVEPAACLALEMRYALDPNRQIKKRNKALQVRFKDICEAQNEQRDSRLAAGQPGEKREAKPVSYRAAYRKYMTVPARRAIPNVTKSTGVQTSPDLKKCYQTFPLDRKKGNLKSIPAADAFKSQNNGFVAEKQEEGAGEEARPWGAGRVHKTAASVFHSDEHVNELDQPAGLNCAEPGENPDAPGCREEPLQNSARPSSREPDHQLHGRAKHGRATPDTEEAAPPAHGTVFKTEVAAVYAPAPGAKALEAALSNSATASEWPLCPAADQERGRASRLNGLQGPAAARSPPMQCLSPECSGRPTQTRAPPGEDGQPCAAAAAAGGESRQIVPHTEVVDLKAQLQVMEDLISSSQETIKVLLGVIQELEKGEAHREGLSYRTGQDTANCETCRNSACVIYSVELDFKQQEDKLRPVLRKLHPFEETQVVPSPYSQEPYSATPKQKSKPESKKHGRWKLWFL